MTTAILYKYLRVLDKIPRTSHRCDDNQPILRITGTGDRSGVSSRNLSPFVQQVKLPAQVAPTQDGRPKEVYPNEWLRLT